MNQLHQKCIRLLKKEPEDQNFNLFNKHFQILFENVPLSFCSFGSLESSLETPFCNDLIRINMLTVGTEINLYILHGDELLSLREKVTGLNSSLGPF